MISPTGRGIRGPDNYGSGAYGASRTKNGKPYMHEGADFICLPGQDIVSPIRGIIMRLKYPYAEPVNGTLFGGVLIKGSNCMVTLFYFEPIKELVTMEVQQGDLIGHAQDIGLKHSGITAHVHMHFDSINPEVFINLP